MIRAARLEDAAAMAVIWNQIIRDTVFTFTAVEVTEESCRNFIAARQQAGRAVLVATAGEKLTGFASYDQFRGAAGYAGAMEHSIYLADTARGQGIGAALLAALETHACGQSHRLFIGAISAQNTAALTFHRKQGFATVAQIPQAGWKFGAPQDLVLVQKFL
ncbi:GNAT family N-acetyltransferase [Pararhodobacter oceanensis]|uniref:GNAT family N-acetyltransferase n=1 Tax=Pararhodobacter oceanensis TaxID=2172121 RepID=UPI001F0C829E|nr:GNAT family N-acetyltransferase [Pararhodobacter oceanensis]